VKRNSRRNGVTPSGEGRSAARPVEAFSGPPLTRFGGAGLLGRFVERLHLAERLVAVTVRVSVGRRYTVADYLLALLLCAMLGLQRQVEWAALRWDEAALRALRLARIPGQSTWSRFLGGCGAWASHQVRRVNRELVAERRKDWRTATMDLDATVISTRGNPERANRGYNPKRKGANCYVALMGFLGETREILDARLRSGKEGTISAQTAWETFGEARQALPRSVRRLRLRADSAFYSHDFLSRLEQEGVRYFIAVRINASLQRRVGGVTFRALDDKWAIGEFEYCGPKCKTTRRMVVIREKLDPTDPPKKQLPLLDCPEYAFQFIVTNSGWRDEDVWHFYNHRCCVENTIKESQRDFGANHVLSHRYGGNALWLAVSVLAYNLWNWFRERVLNEHAHRHTVAYWRRTLIELPARLVCSGRRRWLKLGRGHPSQPLFERALARLSAL